MGLWNCIIPIGGMYEAVFLGWPYLRLDFWVQMGRVEGIASVRICLPCLLCDVDFTEERKMNATENVRKCFALYCRLDEREVEYLNAMICAKGMLSGVVAEPEEKRRVGRPPGSKNREKKYAEDAKKLLSPESWASELGYVDHKDGNPLNNDIQNLTITGNSFIPHTAEGASQLRGVAIVDNGNILVSGEEK